MTAVDQKPPKQNLAHRPRLARKATPKRVATLADPDAYSLLFGEGKEKNIRLWADFARWVRGCGSAWIISAPDHGIVRLQIADRSPLLERLAQFPRFARTVVKLPGAGHRLTANGFELVSEYQITLWRDLTA